METKKLEHLLSLTVQYLVVHITDLMAVKLLHVSQFIYVKCTFFQLLLCIIALSPIPGPCYQLRFLYILNCCCSSVTGKSF